jgi:hypothetical protein
MHRRKVWHGTVLTASRCIRGAVMRASDDSCRGPTAEKRSRLTRTALVAFALVLAATASPRGTLAQVTDPNAKAPLLWTDPETGQVFTKPGAGRVPFAASAAPSTEQSTSQIQALQRDIEHLQQEMKNGNGVQYGGVNLKLGGFIEAAGIYRTRNQVADVGSDYNQGIPFKISPLAHENETRFSARQSRLSLLVSGNVSPETHLAAYYEMDFLASGTTSNSRESNSYVPRTRNIYATLDRDDWGFHLLVGQNWSLMTTNTRGIMPRREQIPMTIDAQYVEGFNWLRVPQFRVVEDFGHGLWAGVSAESPQMVTSPITTPSNVNYTNPGNPAGLLNNATSYSNDYIPDFDGKIAFDPGFGHYEFKSLIRTFTARSSGTTHHTFGYGFGGAAMLPLMPPYVEVQLSGLGGYGIGRYGSGQLPDAAFDPNNTLAAVPELQGLAGLISHPWTGNDLYIYGGWEHADRAGAHSPSGYGSPTLVVSGCDFENADPKTCQAETRDLKQITAGFWQDIYKGTYGRFVFGFQGGYIWRDAFSGAGGAPITNIGIFMTSFRYYPFA